VGVSSISPMLSKRSLAGMLIWSWSGRFETHTSNVLSMLLAVLSIKVEAKKLLLDVVSACRDIQMFVSGTSFQEPTHHADAEP
jgi:hypothetical protein